MSARLLTVGRSENGSFAISEDGSPGFKRRLGACLPERLLVRLRCRGWRNQAGMRGFLSGPTMIDLGKNDPTKMAPLDMVRGGLVVSCQAEPHSPLDSAEFQAAFASIAVRSGVRGIRARGAEHIR